LLQSVIISGFLNMILAMLCDSLSVTDLMTIIGGDMTPLDRARNHIRRFVIEKVLNDNDRPSADG